MDKIKAKPIEKIKNILIVLLTLSMLVLAVIYIGGSQLMSNRAAINTADMPSGAVKAGSADTSADPIHEKKLLAVSYVGIRYSEKVGGAYGSESASDALVAFAKEQIHAMLSSDSRLTPSTREDFIEATTGDFIYISLASPLPYQAIYALCGEYVGAASSSHAANADKMLITFDVYGNSKLRLSDGTKFYTATKSANLSLTEIATLAGDSRLMPFSITENGIAISSASPKMQRLSIKENTPLDTKQQGELLFTLGYNPESIPMAAIEEASISAVSPLGSLTVTADGINYTAALDSGIPMSDFMPAAKNAVDIGMYDVLIASVSLAESLRSIAPDTLGGALSLCLSGIYHDSGVYTVELGLADGGIVISGEAYPYFAKITAKSGRFESIDIRFLTVHKNNYTGSAFPSKWNFDYAASNADIKSFKLCYAPNTIPADDVSAEWHYTVIGGGEE
ncbi:MAG: hypothetical protein IJA60_00405 [Clostridia bacterium]|nr:hypothetical protein [Clostridia bacterium]